MPGMLLYLDPQYRTMSSEQQQALLRSRNAPGPLVPNAEWKQDPATGRVTLVAAEDLGPEGAPVLVSDSPLATAWARQQGLPTSVLGGFVLPPLALRWHAGLPDLGPAVPHHVIGATASPPP